MKNNHYKNKGAEYGIGNTRKRKILELIGSISGKKLLDIGCSTGYLGKVLKDMGNHVDGIELSEVASLEAKKVIDNVYTFDIEGMWPTEVKNNDYDLIIMAEIIEHIFDPMQVLSSISTKLKDNGYIILTTPNFLKWTHRFKFLFGRFKYTDQGALDFGHIRHFTYAYLMEVIKNTGFEVVSENHIFFPGKLTKILKFWPSFFASQFIIKIKKNG